MPPTQSSFVDTYGRFTGSMLVLVTVTSLGWTLFIMVVNFSPSAMVNRMFRTETLDDGEMWLLREPSSVLVGFTGTAFVLTALYQLYLVGYMCARRKKFGAPDDPPEFPDGLNCTNCCDKLVHDTVNLFDDEARQYMKVLEEVPEIIFQTMLLHRYMALGLPQGWIYVYAICIGINCFTRANRLRASTTYHELQDSLNHLKFQWFFCVAFPMALMIYAGASFNLDRMDLKLRHQTLPGDSLARMARFADPNFWHVQMTTKPSLEALIVEDARVFIATFGLLIGYLWRWKSILRAFVTGFKRIRQRNDLDDRDIICGIVQFMAFACLFPFKLCFKAYCAALPLIPVIFGISHVLYGVVLVVAVFVGVHNSNAACQGVSSTCKRNAFEFRAFFRPSTVSCQCIIYVDHAEVTSWSEWNERLDATTALREITNPHLEVVQVSNRLLHELPLLLQKCTNLRELVLIHADTNAIPAWINDLEMLQYLHVRGRAGDTNLARVAEVDDLNALKVIWLEQHANLSRLDMATKYLSSLSTVVLSRLPALGEIPSFEKSAVRVLRFRGLATTNNLPDLPDTLAQLSVTGACAFCCNGYLTDGHCPSCAPSSCVDGQSSPSAHNQKILRRFPAFNCSSNEMQQLIEKPAVDACDGVMNRECSLTANGSKLAAQHHGVCVGMKNLEVVHCSATDDAKTFSP